jgi:hypothetical protein
MKNFSSIRQKLVVYIAENRQMIAGGGTRLLQIALLLRLLLHQRFS